MTLLYALSFFLGQAYTNSKILKIVLAALHVNSKSSMPDMCPQI